MSRHRRGESSGIVRTVSVGSSNGLKMHLSQAGRAFLQRGRIHRSVVPCLNLSHISLPTGQQTSRDAPPNVELRMCKCNEEGILLTVVKDGPNKGRKFWKCRKGEHAACKFFEWDDEPPPPVQTGFGGTAAKGLNSRAPLLNTGASAGGAKDTCYKVASFCLFPFA